jgi:threonine dehydratase
VQHIREGVDLHVRETAVQLVLETRGSEHAREVREAIRAAGYVEPRTIR